MSPIWERSSGNRQNTLSSAEDEQRRVCDGVTRKLAAAAQRRRRSEGQEEQTEAVSLGGADAPFPPLGGSCGLH